MKLYQRLLLILFCVSILPLFALTAQSFWEAKISRQEAQESRRSLTIAFNQQVENFFWSLSRDLSFVPDFERRPQLDASEREAILVNALTYRDDLEAIAFINPDGKVLTYASTENYDSSHGVDTAHQEEFHEAIQTHRLQITSPFESKAGTCVIVYYPLSYGPVFMVVARLDGLLTRLRSVHLGNTGGLWLLGPHGEIVLAPAVNGILASKVQQALTQFEGAEAQNVTIGFLTGSVSRISPIHWTLAFLQDSSEAFRAGQDMERATLFWLALGLIVIVIGSWIFTVDMAKPIKSLSDAAVMVSGDRLDVQIQPRGPVEIERLMGIFNTMVQRLREFKEMQVERMLEEKTKLEAVVRGISDGILILDFQGRLIFGNQRAFEILETTVAEKEQALDILDFSSDVTRDITDVLTRHKDQVVFSTVKMAQGAEKHLRGLARRLKTERKRDIGVMIVVEDVTLDHRVAQLRDDFFNMVTHDLRNPLTSLKASIRLLLDPETGKLDAHQIDLLQRSDQATQDLLEMVSNILDARNYEQGKIHLEVDPVPVGKLLEEIRQRHAPLFQNHTLQFEVRLAEGLNMVDADRNLLMRVLNNLLWNAAKFTVPGGSVRLEVLPHENGILFAVEDTGRGIPAGQIPQLFQRYKQTHASDRIKGTGLGLFICRMIAEAHGGHIGVTSKEGKGSRFEFWLPLKQPDVERQVG